MQVTDDAHTSSSPVYNSRRFESRHEQEFVNGQPVYDLHHERLYKVSFIALFSTSLTMMLSVLNPAAKNGQG